MRKRHLGHRAKIRALESISPKTCCGDDKIFENEVMKHFNLTIIASVEPGPPWTMRRLYQLEGYFQKRLMAMDYNGGMNRRYENVRMRRGS
jgi:hypothetical protein